MIEPLQFGGLDEPLAPPAPLRQAGPALLKITRGGGPIALFGMPFFLAGAFMLLSAVRTVPGQMQSGGTPTILLIPMGLAFLAVGGVMVFGRQWLILDLSRRSIIRQIRLLIPLQTDERPLSDFKAVVMTHNAGDSESPETYPVKLRASTGKDVTITKPLKFGESLQIAQYMARVLLLPIVDSTTDRELRVDPEHVGESLQERLASFTAGEAQPRPLQMASKIEECAGDTTIVVPGGAPMFITYIRILLPVAVFLMAMLVAIPVLINSANPRRLFPILLLIFGLPTVCASIYFALTGKRRNTTVTVSPSGIVIERTQGRKPQKEFLPARDVLDVDYSTFENAIESARLSTDPRAAHVTGNERTLLTLRKLVPNQGIMIKSRNGLITFGEGLSSDELKYLAWLVRRSLLSSRAVAE